MTRSHVGKARRARRLVAIAVLAVVVPLLVAGLWVADRVHYARQLRPVGPGASALVPIDRGTGSVAIAHLLAERHLIRSAAAFRRYVRERGVSQKLKAGCYEFAPSLSMPEIVTKLVKGDVARRKVTIPEGLWLKEIAARLETEGICDADEFVAAASEAQRLAQFRLAGRRASNLEGFLFPDTYFVNCDATAADVVKMMLARFREATARLAPEVQASGRPWREVVTLASVVEAEARHNDERPLIAGVYMARLARGKKLESCPTVIYALGRRVKRLRDVTVDSPYNTYKHRGLPPGPICNPGLESIKAALHPVKTDALYFVAKPDGHHAFAATYAEHLANIKRYLGR